MTGAHIEQCAAESRTDHDSHAEYCLNQRLKEVNTVNVPRRSMSSLQTLDGLERDSHV